METVSSTYGKSTTMATPNKSRQINDCIANYYNRAFCTYIFSGLQESPCKLVLISSNRNTCLHHSIPKNRHCQYGGKYNLQSSLYSIDSTDMLRVFEIETWEIIPEGSAGNWRPTLLPLHLICLFHYAIPCPLYFFTILFTSVAYGISTQTVRQDRAPGRLYVTFFWSRIPHRFGFQLPSPIHQLNELQHTH